MSGFFVVDEDGILSLGSSTRQSDTQTLYTVLLTRLVHQAEDEMTSDELLDLADDLSRVAHNLRYLYAADGPGREMRPII